MAISGLGLVLLPDQGLINNQVFLVQESEENLTQTSGKIPFFGLNTSSYGWVRAAPLYPGVRSVTGWQTAGRWKFMSLRQLPQEINLRFEGKVFSLFFSSLLIYCLLRLCSLDGQLLFSIS